MEICGKFCFACDFRCLIIRNEDVVKIDLFDEGLFQRNDLEIGVIGLKEDLKGLMVN